MGLNKRRPNSWSKKNQHQGPMYVKISKKTFKKSSKIQWKNWAGIPKGSGSSGRVAQLKWDWDNSKGVPRNTRNEEQICPSQAHSGVAKNQKAWRVTIHEQKAGTSGNPEWRTIRGSGWENLQPSMNGFRSIGKNDSKEGQPKAESRK